MTDSTVARTRRPARQVLVVDVRTPAQREFVNAGTRRHLLEGRDDLARPREHEVYQNKQQCGAVSLPDPAILPLRSYRQLMDVATEALNEVDSLNRK